MRERFIRFMAGRYGLDRLGSFLFILYCILGFVRVFVRSRTGSIIIPCFMAIILIFIIFRFLSKNIYRREKENAVFLNILNRTKKEAVLFKDRIKDIKTKRYRKCPYCKNVLRLPKRRGKHTVSCPKCGGRFEVHIL